MKQKLQAIKEDINNALQKGANPHAVFDADGTLWKMDLGFGFFEYQLRNKTLPKIKSNNVEQYHLTLKKYKKKYQTPETLSQALLWLAQINEGKTKQQFQDEVRNYKKEIGKTPVFDLQKEVVSYLIDQSVSITVVTATTQWVVEEFVEDLGISRNNVLGIKTKIENNIITDKQDGPITWGDGKLHAYMEHTKNTKPFFASGNTLGDLSLLESSHSMKLVIHAAPKTDINYESERALLQTAKKNSWWYHDYNNS